MNVVKKQTLGYQIDCIEMKSDFSFNSQSVPVSGSATVSGLPKPRLSKTRRPPGGAHSSLSRDSRVNPLNHPFGYDPLNVNLVSPGGLFSEKGEAFVSGVSRSDPPVNWEKDVIDEMRDMNIGRDVASRPNSKIKEGLGAKGFVFKGDSNTFFGTEETKVADEMMKLNIHHSDQDEFVGKSKDNNLTANDNARRGGGIGDNVHSSIGNYAGAAPPTELKKLNVESTQLPDCADLLFKVEKKKQSVFDSSKANSVFPAGISETVLQGQMNNLNLKDAMNSTRFMFGKNTVTTDGSRARTEEKLCDMMGDMKIGGSRDSTGHSGRFSSFPFPGIYTNNKKTGNTSTDVGESIPTGFTSEAAMPVEGPFFLSSENTSEPPATGRKDGFLFDTKQDGTDSVFKTPNTIGNVFSSLNQKSDSSGRRVAGNSIRSKKATGQSGRQLNPVQVWLGPNISPGRSSSSQENTVSPMAYSPMDVSPYEEKLAGSLSRENSVASDDSFLVDESSDSLPTATNDAMDEDLAFAAQRMNINEGAEKFDQGNQGFSEYQFGKNVSSEFHEESSLYSAETESFKSANEDLDSEASSVSPNIEEQGSDRLLFSSGSSQATTGTNFIFGSSASGQGLVSAGARQYNKKNWLNAGIDSSSHTIPSITSLYSSAHVQFPFSGASSLSSPRYSLAEVTSTLQHRRNEFEEIKHGSTSTSSTAVAVQEACEKWRLRGNQSYSNGDFLKAEDYYTHGVNSVPRTETSRSCRRALMLCYSNRAATRMSLGRMREALKDCMLAGAIDPCFLRVQLRAANCYLDLGEVEEALQYFQKCLIQGRDVCVDRKVMVEASEGIQKSQKVAEYLCKSTDILNLKTTIDAESALSIIAEAMTISPHSEKLLEMKAMTLFLSRKYEEVIQLCDQSAVFAKMNFPPIGSDSQSSNSDCSVMLWRLKLIFKSYFYLGKLEEALGLLEKQDNLRNRSNTLESSTPLAITRELLRHKAAGNEAFQSRKHAEAVEHYTAALSCTVESRPFAAKCFCNRAAAFKALNQISDAIADCSLAIALDQKYLKALSRRASLYEMIRDYGQAANDLERLVSFLLKQVGDGSGDRSINITNDLRQAQSRLSEVESEARKEIPLNMYLILGIEASVSASEIKKAYRKAALKHHPDKAGHSLAKSDNGEDSLWREIAEEVRKDTDRLFKMIGEAYAVLSNPMKRARYDLEEETRTSQKMGNVTSTSRVHTDAQYYPSERTGSRPNWMGARKSYWHS